ADLCVGLLSSRLSEDYFKNAQSIDKKFTEDDLTVCSDGVSDGTYDAYLHFDPVPYLPELRSIPTGIVSGIPIWVAGDNSTGTTSTTTISSTTTSASQPCPIEEVYGESSDTTKYLRKFRDNVLNTSFEGQALVKLYYEWSPVIVNAMEKDEEFKVKVKGVIDKVLSIIGGME
ncbi:MAG: hypothetical protein JW976_06965, partial [Syntrophaceae bacterium]|nr:hypothetical protein [Syntrophaceae bacterium]